MCSHIPDPRDEVFAAARAVRALHALLQNGSHVCYGDAELPVLVEFIDDRLYNAALALQDFVPKDHPAAAA